MSMPDRQAHGLCPFCRAPVSDQPTEGSRFGERAAMRVARAIANWRFVAIVLTGALTWIILNIAILPLSPFPMVMISGLSAGLSLLAALYGPVLLLTQRVEAAQDRARARTILSAALVSEQILEGDQRTSQ